MAGFTRPPFTEPQAPTSKAANNADVSFPQGREFQKTRSLNLVTVHMVLLCVHLTCLASGLGEGGACHLSAQLRTWARWEDGTARPGSQSWEAGSRAWARGFWFSWALLTVGLREPFLSRGSGNLSSLSSFWTMPPSSFRGSWYRQHRLWHLNTHRRAHLLFSHVHLPCSVMHSCTSSPA